MSSTRLCVRISNCSRDFLSMCGERLTVNFSMRVGSGIGPAHGRAGALGRVDDLAGGMVQHAVIEGLEPDADVLTIHIALFVPYRRRTARVISTISKTNPNPPKREPVRVSPQKRLRPARYPRGPVPETPMKALSQLVLRTASSPCELQPVQQEARYYRCDSLASRARRAVFGRPPFARSSVPDGDAAGAHHRLGDRAGHLPGAHVAGAGDAGLQACRRRRRSRRRRSRPRATVMVVAWPDGHLHVAGARDMHVQRRRRSRPR